MAGNTCPHSPYFCATQGASQPWSRAPYHTTYIVRIFNRDLRTVQRPQICKQAALDPRTASGRTYTRTSHTRTDSDFSSNTAMKCSLLNRVVNVLLISLRV